MRCYGAVQVRNSRCPRGDLVTDATGCVQPPSPSLAISYTWNLRHVFPGGTTVRSRVLLPTVSLWPPSVSGPVSYTWNPRHVFRLRTAVRSRVLFQRQAAGRRFRLDRVCFKRCWYTWNPRHVLRSRCVRRKVEQRPDSLNRKWFAAQNSTPEGSTRGTRRRPVYVDSRRGYGVSADIWHDGGRCRSSRPEGKRLPLASGPVEFFVSSWGGLAVFPDLEGVTVPLR